MSYKFVFENVSTNVSGERIKFSFRKLDEWSFPCIFCVYTDDDLANLQHEKNKKRVLYVLNDLKKGKYNIKEKCGLNLMDEIGSSEEGSF